MINFFSKVIGLMDEVRELDVGYTDFNKVFDTVCHNTSTDRLRSTGYKCTKS